MDALTGRAGDGDGSVVGVGARRLRPRRVRAGIALVARGACAVSPVGSGACERGCGGCPQTPKRPGSWQDRSPRMKIVSRPASTGSRCGAALPGDCGPDGRYRRERRFFPVERFTTVASATSDNRGVARTSGQIRTRSWDWNFCNSRQLWRPSPLRRCSGSLSSLSLDEPWSTGKAALRGATRLGETRPA